MVPLPPPSSTDNTTTSATAFCLTYLGSMTAFFAKKCSSAQSVAILQPMAREGVILSRARLAVIEFGHYLVAEIKKMHFRTLYLAFNHRLVSDPRAFGLNTAQFGSFSRIQNWTFSRLCFLIWTSLSNSQPIKALFKRRFLLKNKDLILYNL